MFLVGWVGATYSDWGFSNILDILNLLPNDPAPEITSVDGTNKTGSDLNCSAVLSDDDEDTLNVSVKWFRDGVLHSVFDYENSYASGSMFSAILDSGNTSDGEVWSCYVRAWDYYGSSEPECYLVFPTPANGTSQTSDSIYVNYYTNDMDGDDIYSFINFDNSLVGWWRLDNDSSVGENDTLVYDWSGNGNNGSVVDASWSSDGRFGGAFSFDGDGDYVMVSNPNVNFTEGSINVWIKSYSSATEKGIIYTGYGGGTYEYFGILILDGNVRIDIDDGDGCGIKSVTSSGTNYSDSSWHQITLTFINQDMGKLYIDSIEQGSGVSLSGCNPEISPFYDLKIGMQALSDSYFNGYIDEVMVFNRSLSSEEITALYNATATYHNFTSQEVGNHTFTTYVVDEDGNMNYTETREVEITI